MSLYQLVSTSHRLSVGAASYFAVATAADDYASDALAIPNLWAYYRMGEAADADTMLDSSSDGRHGSWIGPPELGQGPLVLDVEGNKAARLHVGGVYGQAPIFNGPAMTLVMTIQITNVTPQSIIAAQDFNLPNDGWSLECVNGKLRAYIRSAAGGGTAQWIDDPTVLTPATDGYGTLVAGQRHTVGLSWGAGGAELWIDGARIARQATLTDAPIGSAVPPNDSWISLGSYHGSTGLIGYIDEALIYVRQLTSGEHLTLARPDALVLFPPPVANDDPATGRHAVTAGTAEQTFNVLGNDDNASAVQSVGTPSIGSARVVGGTQIGYTPPSSVGSATNVDISHAVSGPGVGTDTAVLRLTVNPAASSFGYPCLAKSGLTPIVLSGDRNSSQTLLRQSDGDGARYDCRTLIARVRNGGNTSASYKTAVIITSYGGCISGGRYLGENSFNTGWSGIYLNGTNGALEIGRNASAGNVTVDNVYGYNTWDCLKVAGHNDFDEPSIFQGCYIEHNRDDAIENDGLMSMIVRDCLFDGCFVAFSQRLGTGYNPPGTHKSIYENTLVRMFPYKTGGGSNNGDQGGPNLNPGHKGVWKLESNSPQMEVRNMIIAVQQDGNFSANSSFGVPSGDILIDYKIEQQRGKVEVSTNNRIVGLGGYVYNKGLPPGWTFTSDDNVWWTARADWLARHNAEVAQHKRPTMPSGLSLDQP